MKVTIFIVGILLSVSCGELAADTNDANSENLEGNTTKLKETTQSHDPLGNPCQLSADIVADIIGWSDHFEGSPNSMNSDNMKACDYSTKLGGALTIMFQRYDKNSEDKKYLEDGYQRRLEASSDKRSYQDVSGGTELGDQAIYSYGMNGPNHEYKLYWRYGNHTERTINLRSTEKRDSEATKAQLKALAFKLAE